MNKKQKQEMSHDDCDDDFTETSETGTKELRERMSATNREESEEEEAGSESEEEDSDGEEVGSEEEVKKGVEFEEEEAGSESEESDGEEAESEEAKKGAEFEEEEAGSEAEEEGLEGDEEGAESEEEADSDAEEEQRDDEEEDDEGPNELRTKEDVQRELSHMSFEDVLKLQNKVGTKVYNKVKHGTESETSEKHKKRLNKNRPMEVSAKRPVPFLRQVVSVKKTTLRDPRFDDLSGEYRADIFEKTYSFINDIKHKEKEVLKKKLKKTKNEQKKEKLQFLVKRMENQERARLSREQQRNKELQFKRKQRERANQGQAPHFLKNSERKKLQLLDKYEGLKKSGKLEQFLTKKRKRNAVKDRRKLPSQPHKN